MPALMYGGASAANDGGGANGNVTTDDAFVSFYFGALGGDVRPFYLSASTAQS